MDGERLVVAHNCAVEDTIEFVSDMSGTLSPDKCCTLANDKALRARFKAHRYVGIQGHSPIKVGMRDLGAHLCLAVRLTAATLTQRMLK
eukprot:1835727-Alexandrium_andersonii.AAC.1